MKANNRKILFLLILLTVTLSHSQQSDDALYTSKEYFEDQLVKRGYNLDNLKKDPIYLGKIDKVAYFIYNPKLKDREIKLVGIYNNIDEDEELFDLEYFSDSWSYNGNRDKVLQKNYRFKNPDAYIDPLIKLINTKIETYWFSEIDVNYYVDEYNFSGFNFENRNLEKPIAHIGLGNRIFVNGRRVKVDDWCINSTGSDYELIGVLNSVKEAKSQLEFRKNGKEKINRIAELQESNIRFNDSILKQFYKTKGYLNIPEEKWKEYPLIEFYVKNIYEGKFDAFTEYYNKNRMNYIFRAVTNYISENCESVLSKNAREFEFVDVFDGGSEYLSTSYLGRGLYINNYRELPDKQISYSIKMEPEVKRTYEYTRKNGLISANLLLVSNPTKVIEGRINMAKQLQSFIESIGCNSRFWKLFHKNLNSFMSDNNSKSLQEISGIVYKETDYKILYKKFINE